MANVYNSQLDAFELFHIVREEKATSSSGGSALEILGHAISGCAGASISNVTTYPLNLIITRLQIQRQLRKDKSQPSQDEYKSLDDALRKIYHNEGGLSGFYTGVLQDTGKTIADSFIFFLAYTWLRERRITALGNRRSLPALDELGVGFVAGSFTKLLTTPIANIVTRKQAAALTSTNSLGNTSGISTQSPSTSQIAQDIRTEKGLLGFWSGYSASLVLTLNPSITFFLFETLKRMLLPRSRRDNPPASATFLLSAISKVCATMVTYPFSLAKSRLQVGSKREEQDEKAVVGKDIHNENAQKATRSTIFSTLLTIAQSEGASALYEGLPLEVTKAFFSHGITMLVKQILQRFLAQAYYITSIIMARYRRRARAHGRRLADRARRSVEYYDLAMARAGEKVEEASNAIICKANETAEFVAEYVVEDDEKWRELYGPLGLSRWLQGDRE